MTRSVMCCGCLVDQLFTLDRCRQRGFASMIGYTSESTPAQELGEHRVWSCCVDGSAGVVLEESATNRDTITGVDSLVDQQLKSSRWRAEQRAGDGSYAGPAQYYLVPTPAHLLPPGSVSWPAARSSSTGVWLPHPSLSCPQRVRCGSFSSLPVHVLLFRVSAFLCLCFSCRHRWFSESESHSMQSGRLVDCVCIMHFGAMSIVLLSRPDVAIHPPWRSAPRSCLFKRSADV